MGWLVQAEAHPGALFRAFRKVILDRPQAPQLQGGRKIGGFWGASLAANLGLENVKPTTRRFNDSRPFSSEISFLLSKKLEFVSLM